MIFLNRLIPCLAVFSLIFLFAGVNTSNAQDLEQVFAEQLEEIEIERTKEEKRETVKETKEVVQEDTATPTVAEEGQLCSASISGASHPASC